jgi:sec-independent protein translocase protein TatC
VKTIIINLDCICLPQLVKEENKITDKKVPFLEHLTELRSRLIVSFIVFAVFFGILFYYSEYLYHLMILPMKSKLTLHKSFPFVNFIPMEIKDASFIVTAPGERFWMHIKISVVGAIVLSLPVILYQTWKFIAPGLFPNEKRYLGPFIVASSIFFIIGAAFCFIVVLPFALGFLLEYKMDQTQDLKTLISIGEYINFTLKFVVSFGAVFELPIIILLLTKMGIVTPVILSKKRKYAVLLAFIIAAILTPTGDAFNLMLMAVPILILYEVGILASRFIANRKGKKDSINGSDLLLALISIPLIHQIITGFKKELHRGYS